MCPEAIITSGLRATIVSASGFLKSILGISGFNPFTSAEYLSTPTILSPSPKPTNISVLDGAVDIILSIFLGTVNSVPSISFIVTVLLPHPVNISNDIMVIITKEITFLKFLIFFLTIYKSKSELS